MGIKVFKKPGGFNEKSLFYTRFWFWTYMNMTGGLWAKKK